MNNKIILILILTMMFSLVAYSKKDTTRLNYLEEYVKTRRPDTTKAFIDDTIYIGEYLDSDYGEPSLEIANGNDGNYIVQISIYRLTVLSDGIGELTSEGMKFTATDAAGNPIHGVIVVKNQTANVTFTNSTWVYLENGATFSYQKSSDIPNIRPE